MATLATSVSETMIYYFVSTVVFSIGLAFIVFGSLSMKWSTTTFYIIMGIFFVVYQASEYLFAAELDTKYGLNINYY
jgi:hypothetical protein